MGFHLIAFRGSSRPCGCPWAVGAGYRGDDPTAAAVKTLPRHTDKPQHHRALHHGEVAAALDTIRASKASTASKLGIELLTLTATRSGEVRGARWLINEYRRAA